jgi:hypothetical protein
MSESDTPLSLVRGCNELTQSVKDKSDVLVVFSYSQTAPPTGARQK